MNLIYEHMDRSICVDTNQGGSRQKTIEISQLRLSMYISLPTHQRFPGKNHADT